MSSSYERANNTSDQDAHIYMDSPSNKNLSLKCIARNGNADGSTKIDDKIVYVGTASKKPGTKSSNHPPSRKSSKIQKNNNDNTNFPVKSPPRTLGRPIIRITSPTLKTNQEGKKETKEKEETTEKEKTKVKEEMNKNEEMKVKEEIKEIKKEEKTEEEEETDEEEEESEEEEEDTDEEEEDMGEDVGEEKKETENGEKNKENKEMGPQDVKKEIVENERIKSKLDFASAGEINKIIQQKRMITSRKSSTDDEYYERLMMQHPNIGNLEEEEEGKSESHDTSAEAVSIVCEPHIPRPSKTQSKETHKSGVMFWTKANELLETMFLINWPDDADADASSPVDRPIKRKLFSTISTQTDWTIPWDCEDNKTLEMSYDRSNRRAGTDSSDENHTLGCFYETLFVRKKPSQ